MQIRNNYDSSILREFLIFGELYKMKKYVFQLNFRCDRIDSLMLIV